MWQRIHPALCLGVLSTPAAAHPGHDGNTGFSLLHYLSTAEHAAGLGLLIALIVGVTLSHRIARRRGSR